MTDAATLLAAYDDQLRTDAETPSALSVTEHGPLRLVTFARGRGFVTYRDLDGADAAGIRDLVAAAVAHFTADPEVTRVEWKTRGHDRAPGLHEALARGRLRAARDGVDHDGRGAASWRSTSTSPRGSPCARSPTRRTCAR